MWRDKEDGAGDDLDMPVCKGDRSSKEGVKLETCRRSIATRLFGVKTTCSRYTRTDTRSLRPEAWGKARSSPSPERREDSPAMMGARKPYIW